MMTAEASWKYGSVVSAFHWLPYFSATAASTQMRSECENAAESPSNTACQTVPRIATMNAAIIVLECPGSRPCKAPRSMAVGMKSHA